MENKVKILVVDEGFCSLHALSKRLSLRDYDVTPVTSGQQAIQYARDDDFDLAIIDLKTSRMSGEEVLKTLKAEHPFMQIIILTGHGTVESNVTYTRLGAFYYLQKPCEVEELLTVLENAYQNRIRRNLSLNKNRFKDAQIVPIRKSSLGV